MKEREELKAGVGWGAEKGIQWNALPWHVSVYYRAQGCFHSFCRQRIPLEKKMNTREQK